MLVTILVRVLQAYSFIILGSVLLSWIPNKQGLLADIATALDTLSEPLLGPIRNILPTFGGIDFSPIVAILVIQAVQMLVVTLF